MLIGAMDYSIASPGLVKFVLDKDLNVEEKYYKGFCQTKKFESKDIVYYNVKKDFNNDLQRKIWLKDQIFDFLNQCDFIALEGYAYGAVGQVFDIAEGCGITKKALYERGIKLRIYDPPSIKKYATNFGNADKTRMEEDYEKLEDKIDFNLPLVKDKVSGNPKDNLVDAFFICKLLHLELKIRHGITLLKDLDVKKIEIFNQVSKKNPDNLLTRPFLERK